MATGYAARWLALLDGSREVLLATLVDEREDAVALRQSTPFTFVVGPRERWRLWREVRAEAEAAE